MRKLIVMLSVGVVLTAAVASHTESPMQHIALQTVSRPERLTKRQTGGIEGRVINAGGEGVPGAKVFANSDHAGSSLAYPSITDKDGNFRIEVPETGTFTVYASKEEDGYPLTISGFHREFLTPIPKIEFIVNQVVRDVIVQLGEKAAKIEGVVRDAADSSPISRAKVTLRRADNPELLYSVGVEDPKEIGRFEILVPNVPFTIEVLSPGYDDWTYSKDSQRSLKLNRGESRNLEVSLEKKKRD